LGDLALRFWHTEIEVCSHQRALSTAINRRY